MTFRPLTYAEKVAKYGEPGKFVGTRFVPSQRWQNTRLTRMAMPWPRIDSRYGFARPVRVHVEALDDFKRLFESWLDARVLRYLFELGGCYDPITERWDDGTANPEHISPRAFGIAIVLNPAYNRYRLRPAREGQDGYLQPLVEPARRLGWHWRGKDRIPDGSLFEIGTDA